VLLAARLQKINEDKQPLWRIVEKSGVYIRRLATRGPLLGRRLRGTASVRKTSENQAPLTQLRYHIASIRQVRLKIITI
jgi:hypothetical protein